jgi:E3 ubiquitin-protein ligase MUL1
MVVGVVKSDSKPLVSQYDKSVFGPVRIFEIKEHGTIWRSSYARDTVRMIKREVNTVPFSLIKIGANGTKHIVKVENPMLSSYIGDALETAYSHFEATKESTVTKIIHELATSERVRGIENSEHLLREGVQLTAFGRIEAFKMDDTASSMFKWISKSSSNKINGYKLTEPINNSDQMFILTTMNRAELTKKLAEENTTLKGAIWVFGSIGLVVGGFVAYKLISDYIEKKKKRELMAKAKEERERARLNRIRQSQENNGENRAGAAATGANDDQTHCVVCLTNPRETVLLDCGHVCLCNDCVELIPNKKCPICRQTFRTHMPCFIP